MDPRVRSHTYFCLSMRRMSLHLKDVKGAKLAVRVAISMIRQVGR